MRTFIQVLIQQVFIATVLFDYDSVGCCGASAHKSPASVLRAGLPSRDCIHRWLGASELLDRVWHEQNRSVELHLMLLRERRRERAAGVHATYHPNLDTFEIEKLHY